MIRHYPVALGAALVVGLGACSGNGGGGGGGGAIEPGEWETTVELTSLDVNNLPPDMRRDMHMPTERRTTTRGCWVMSAEQVRIRNLRFTIPNPFSREASCTFPELLLEGGTLRGRMTCTGIPAPPRTGGAQTMSFSSDLDGSYTPNSLQATARGEVRFGQFGGSGAVRITSRRLGQCPPPPRYIPPPMPDTAPMNEPMIMVPPPPRDRTGEAVNALATPR